MRVPEPPPAHAASAPERAASPAPLPVAPDAYLLYRREALYRWILGRCAAHGASRVVDLGCGDGYGSALLAAGGLEVVGLTDDPLTTHAAAKAWRFGRIAFRTADLPRTDESQHSFDAVVSTGLLERLSDPRPLFSEVRHLLGPGGLVVLATPNRLTASPGRTRPMAADRAWEYTPDEFRRAARMLLPSVEVVGVFHGRRLRALERVVGGSLVQALDRVRPPDRTAWLRWALRGLSASSFEIHGERLRDALDLVVAGTV